MDPAGLRLAWPGGQASVQPRAMQVLIQLSRAKGAVVSRDSLIQSCWGSRAVSDDSINRVIHLLRQVARQSGGQGFAIHTIATVGYRLSAPGGDEEAGGEPRLAVLAFDNLTGDAGLDYFSDGLSEEILFTVGKRVALAVVGRSSSFSLRGAEKSPARAGALLGATHVLDGSVRRSGDRVRITAELVDCASRATLWSDRFERSLVDVFAVEDEIAAAVAAALKVACAPGARAAAIDPTAFDLYLKARHLDSEWNLPQIGLLEQATARAPPSLTPGRCSPTPGRLRCAGWRGATISRAAAPPSPTRRAMPWRPIPTRRSPISLWRRSSRSADDGRRIERSSTGRWRRSRTKPSC